MQKIVRTYARFLSRKPFLVLVLAMLFSVFMFYNVSNLGMKGIELEDVLPKGSEEIRTMDLIVDEFASEVTVLFFVEIDNSYINSDEPKDVRDPRVLRYIDVLTHKAESLDYVNRVVSLSVIVKEANGGYIPNSVNEVQSVLSNIMNINLMSKDGSFTLVSLVMNDIPYENAESIINELQDLIDETEKPSGVSAKLAGGAVEAVEVDRLVGPDSQKTSIISLIGILVILFFLLRSFKGTLLTVGTILFGIIWGLGFTSIIGMKLNPITMSVTTMIMGIGIDFGIQVITRFKYELNRFDKQKAMEETLVNIFFPMSITTVAALVGFRAMSLGELTIMAELGTIMSFGVAGCFLAAFSIIPSLLVLTTRKKV
ncbi:MAG: MMPL family transporter [Nanoarchaeota archaeon]|nr:MMPL family transporter [Nanoarchaeota archaeon]